MKHKGGNYKFWNDNEVDQYQNIQRRVEKKEEALSYILRVLKYFSIDFNKKLNILDIGCGEGKFTYRILKTFKNCNVIGIDASQQMLDKADFIKNEYPNRFKSYCLNFNDSNFWKPEIEMQYDFIISSMSLHYLSDQIMPLFYKQIYNHLHKNGIFIGLIANISRIEEIRKMQETFKNEHTYKIEYEKDNTLNYIDHLENERIRAEKINLNWKSNFDYLDLLKNAGFKKYDIIWHHWIKSIFLAIN